MTAGQAATVAIAVAGRAPLLRLADKKATARKYSSHDSASSRFFARPPDEADEAVADVPAPPSTIAAAVICARPLVVAAAAGVTATDATAAGAGVASVASAVAVALPPGRVVAAILCEHPIVRSQRRLPGFGETLQVAQEGVLLARLSVDVVVGKSRVRWKSRRIVRADFELSNSARTRFFCAPRAPQLRRHEFPAARGWGRRRRGACTCAACIALLAAKCALR